ncbi:hypothetical protein ABT337_03995 [Saccharopolyspora hirsuta]|uniref:hypothetical protein n=1 Tax=Saccharopolyspora hirsuta TaxID=1837 RepID=UPI00332C1944
MDLIATGTGDVHSPVAENMRSAERVLTISGSRVRRKIDLERGSRGAEIDGIAIVAYSGVFRTVPGK